MSITSTVPSSSRRSACGAWDPVGFHDVRGVSLATARCGAGPLVVCLHATGHGARDYEPFARELAGEFEVVAVDWPGQGRSSDDREAATAARYGDLLEALLEDLDRGPAILVGCSIGGAAALRVAAARPDLVRGLVLCNSGGLAPLDAVSRFAIGRMVAFFEAGARGAGWFPRAFDWYYRLVLPEEGARAQRDRIVAAARETAPVLAQAWRSFAAADADLRETARAVRCPTLLAWAKGDRILPWARSARGAEGIAHRRVELFRGGHAAFLEDAARFCAVFREFAASLPSEEAAVSPPRAASA